MGAGEGGLAETPLLLRSPPKGGPKMMKRKSSWHRRRRSKILAVSLQHRKGMRGGGVTPSSCGVRPF